MRPFRFFFAISLGVIIFFFLARFVIMALFIAAILSVLFYIGRRMRAFFTNLRWEDDYGYNHEPDWNTLGYELPKPRNDRYFDSVINQQDYVRNYRTIEIH